MIVNLSSDAGPQIKNALTVSSLFLLFLIIRRWGVVVRLYVLLRHSATCIVDPSLKPYGNDCCGCYGGYGYQGGAGDCGAGCCDSDFYCPCCACCDTRYRRGGGSLLLLLLLLLMWSHDGLCWRRSEGVVVPSPHQASTPPHCFCAFAFALSSLLRLLTDSASGYPTYPIPPNVPPIVFQPTARPPLIAYPSAIPPVPTIPPPYTPAYTPISPIVPAQLPTIRFSPATPGPLVYPPVLRSFGTEPYPSYHLGPQAEPPAPLPTPRRTPARRHSVGTPYPRGGIEYGNQLGLRESPHESHRSYRSPTPFSPLQERPSGRSSSRDLADNSAENSQDYTPELRRHRQYESPRYGEQPVDPIFTGSRPRRSRSSTLQ